MHQALSDPATYGFLWSLSPLVRTDAMYRSALRMCGTDVIDVPYALTNRPLRRWARREQNGLSAFVHRYPRWIARDLADLIDEDLSKDWFDATEMLDGGRIRQRWEAIRGSPDPHPPTAYLLIWLCALRRLGDALSLGESRGSRASNGRSATPNEVPARQPSPPWGFAGRARDGRWRRLAALPHQALNVLECTGRHRQDDWSARSGRERQETTERQAVGRRYSA